MKKTQNIYLIGPMGSGKTSVGRRLAKLAQLAFYDADEEIEKRSGVPISWIFDVENEAGFRRREESIIVELSQLKGVVLSTGGGCVISEKNRIQLSNTGWVIYLQVSLNQQLERTGRRKGIRPLLEKDNPAEKLKELNEKRGLLYSGIADFIYKTDQFSPQTLAYQILKSVKKKEKVCCYSNSRRDGLPHENVQI